jgi:hypothetical protein
MASVLMGRFLTTLAQGSEAEALENLKLCEAAAGFADACMAGALDHCKVLDQGAAGSSRPLEVAARKGYSNILERLLALGADPTLPVEVRELSSRTRHF